jgi:hypothetical protein
MSIEIQLLKSGKFSHIIITNETNKSFYLIQWYNEEFHLDSIENIDKIFYVNNVALFNILNKTFRLPSGTFKDVTCILAQMMFSVTACFRFSDETNFSLKDMKKTHTTKDRRGISLPLSSVPCHSLWCESRSN